MYLPPPILIFFNILTIGQTLPLFESSIVRIKASNKSIYISDGDAIYRFSRSGEYLGKIAQKGQGPKHIR